MTNHQEVINKISKQLIPNSRAIFVTGSVANNEATSKSDLDMLVITLSDHFFEDKEIDGIVVETKGNTIDGFKLKMETNPINVYQWLDAKPIFDPENLLVDIHNFAQNIIDNFTPSDFPRKWLKSAKIKIESAQKDRNELLLGFNVSTILWKIIEGLYTINSLPTPPSSTAFRKVTDLENVPLNFSIIWSEALTGDLDIRTKATLTLIYFLLDQNL